MFSEINQKRERQMLCFHLHVEPKKIKQYNKTETDSQYKRANYCLSVGKGLGKEQDRGRGLRGTND